MSEDQHRTKYRKELASRCDDATRQRPKMCNRQKYKILQINSGLQQFTSYYYGNVAPIVQSAQWDTANTIIAP